jgi:hypothetical protein
MGKHNYAVVCCIIGSFISIISGYGMFKSLYGYVLY